jgi:hypothetical protein
MEKVALAMERAKLQGLEFFARGAGEWFDLLLMG